MLGMHITARDLEILKFLLDMKFATINDIHEKFFRVTQEGKISTSLYYARERLRLLRYNLFVEQVKFRYTDRIFFLPTANAFSLIESLPNTSSIIAKPIKQIDIRTFEHDYLLTKCRLQLERKQVVTEWKSEKALHRTLFLETSRFVKDMVPDAIYSTQDSVVAFELELTLKSKKRYSHKLRKYSDILRNTQKEIPLSFDEVFFVCSTPGIQRSIEKELSWLPENHNFRFQQLRDFISNTGVITSEKLRGPIFKTYQADFEKSY